ncbi:peroxiredoxin-like family protein [Dyella silvae]|uniref:peroxiredoxin-like family protein n=1 Tax=Dyella silvae TaxID=2994424 RepID=UPI002264DF49|nr:peroxiredoxin-like family protein [Dyella silvae]
MSSMKRSSNSPRLRKGASLPFRNLITIHGDCINLPDGYRTIHLQFRRFAGCPICKLHLHDIAQRHQELVKANIVEVAVFHSTAEVLREHGHALPFALVADPDRILYREFGVEASLRSVLDPRAWKAIVQGLARFGAGRKAGESAMGLPADFLISRGGNILDLKYGEHADDHWSVDEILERSRALALDIHTSEATQTPEPVTTESARTLSRN